LTAEVSLSDRGSSTDLVMLFMNDHALQSLLGDKFKLGADASVAAGRWAGMPPPHRPENECRDFVLFAFQGVFAGVSLDGAVMKADKSGDRPCMARRKPRSS